MFEDQSLSLGYSILIGNRRTNLIQHLLEIVAFNQQLMEHHRHWNSTGMFSEKITTVESKLMHMIPCACGFFCEELSKQLSPSVLSQYLQGNDKNYHCEGKTFNGMQYNCSGVGTGVQRCGERVENKLTYFSCLRIRAWVWDTVF